MRIPTHQQHEISFFHVATFHPIRLPKFLIPVECGRSTTGFSSPADDYIDARLDLNEYHNIHQHTTFLVRAVGESMIDAGITENDLLIVDTRLMYRTGDIVICCLNDVYKAKILHKQDGHLYLISRNSAFEPIEIRPSDDLRIFGVVKGFSRNFRRD